MDQRVVYKGKTVGIRFNATGSEAVVNIDGQEFPIRQHHAGKPDDNYIRLWMCEDAYSMFETPQLLARHLVNFWHQFRKDKEV